LEKEWGKWGKLAPNKTNRYAIYIVYILVYSTINEVMISCCWAVAESHRLPEHPGVYCGELCCFKKQAARYGMEVTSMTSIFMAQGVM